ncbi:hypothetical protein GTZ99_00735 [Novosphingobium sp. FSY-8]|uniref:MFS family arabinose efflux permease n=1 Tax=Novosphingobium ovatum TaxID=1908523 RepID=A0ABW9X993_9SPHN|nr:hypothetical protein [Novosphingobium ovatum]NBC35079.1 hypothetical protein [Novosphingobium ovatum]
MRKGAPDDAVAERGLTGRAKVAVVLCCLFGSCATLLQPLLLGRLVQSGALTPAQLGHAAAAQAAGMLLVSTLAATFLAKTQLRLKAGLAMVLGALCNGLTPLLHDTAIILIRFANGCSSGLLIWLLISMLTRDNAPALTLGLFNALRTGVALVMAGLMILQIPLWLSADSGYQLFALLQAISAIAVIGLPDRLAPDTTQTSGAARPWAARLPGLPGLLGLAGSLLFMAGIMGFWIYAEQVVEGRSFSGANASYLLPLSLFGQMLGGMLSALIARHAAPYWAILCGIGAICLAMVTVAGLDHPLAHVLAFLEFGFFWIFVPTFQIPLLMQLDGGPRAALLNPTAQMSGSAMGPFLAAQLVHWHSADKIPLLAMALVLGAAGAITMAHRLASRRRTMQA